MSELIRKIVILTDESDTALRQACACDRCFVWHHVDDEYYRFDLMRSDRDGVAIEDAPFCPKCGTMFSADPKGIVTATWWPGPELAGTEIACDVLGEQLQAARDLALSRAEDPDETLRSFAREVFDATYCDLGAMPDMPEWSKHNVANRPQEAARERGFETVAS
jgi:hypothetical protein